MYQFNRMLMLDERIYNKEAKYEPQIQNEHRAV